MISHIFIAYNIEGPNQPFTNMTLEDFENASPYFALFLQTVYAIEKLLEDLNVQPRIGMNLSLI